MYIYVCLFVCGWRPWIVSFSKTSSEDFRVFLPFFLCLGQDALPLDAVLWRICHRVVRKATRGYGCYMTNVGIMCYVIFRDTLEMDM